MKRIVLNIPIVTSYLKVGVDGIKCLGVFRQLGTDVFGPNEDVRPVPGVPPPECRTTQESPALERGGKPYQGPGKKEGGGGKGEEGRGRREGGGGKGEEGRGRREGGGGKGEEGRGRRGGGGRGFQGKGDEEKGTCVTSLQIVPHN